MAGTIGGGLFLEEIYELTGWPFLHHSGHFLPVPGPFHLYAVNYKVRGVFGAFFKLCV